MFRSFHLRKFSFLLSVVAGGLLSGSVSAQELSTDEQTALLAKLQQQRATMPALTATFSEERTSKLVNKPLVNTGTMAFQAPNKFRREIGGEAPSTTVCNGRELWIYYPAFKEAEHYTLGQKKMFDDSLAALTAGLNFQDVDKFFRVKVAKDNGSYRVALTPKSGGLKKLLTSLTVSLDAEGLIQKTDAALPEGGRVVTSYKNVRPAKQSDAKFDFAPPSGSTIKNPLGK